MTGLGFGRSARVAELVVRDVTATRGLGWASCLLQRWSFLPAELPEPEVGLTHLIARTWIDAALICRVVWLCLPSVA